LFRVLVDNVEVAVSLDRGRKDRLLIRCSACGEVCVHVEGRNKELEILIKTSLSRTDTDRGACEIIYVNRLRVGDRIYR